MCTHIRGRILGPLGENSSLDGTSVHKQNIERGKFGAKYLSQESNLSERHQARRHLYQLQMGYIPLSKYCTLLMDIVEEEGVTYAHTHVAKRQREIPEMLQRK